LDYLTFKRKIACWVLTVKYIKQRGIRHTLQTHAVLVASEVMREAISRPRVA